jgi:hypothetical protein
MQHVGQLLAKGPMRAEEPADLFDFVLLHQSTALHWTEKKLFFGQRVGCKLSQSKRKQWDCALEQKVKETMNVPEPVEFATHKEQCLTVLSVHLRDFLPVCVLLELVHQFLMTPDAYREETSRSVIRASWYLNLQEPRLSTQVVLCAHASGWLLLWEDHSHSFFQCASSTSCALGPDVSRSNLQTTIRTLAQRQSSAPLTLRTLALRRLCEELREEKIQTLFLRLWSKYCDATRDIPLL